MSECKLGRELEPKPQSKASKSWTKERRERQSEHVKKCHEIVRKAKLEGTSKKIVHKVPKSKEWRKRQSEMMKALHAKYKAEGKVLGNPPNRKRGNKSPLQSAAKKRMHRQNCPFTMVDGVKLEMENMDRYNTHSGVITEDEAGFICE